MPDKSTSIQIDLDTVLTTGKLPAVLGLVAGLLWLIAYQSLLVTLLAWLLYAAAGLSYADRAAKSNRALGTLEAAASGAVSGALVGTAYSIGVLISQTIVHLGIFVYGLDFVVQQILVATVISALAAVVWTARQTQSPH